MVFATYVEEVRVGSERGCTIGRGKTAFKKKGLTQVYVNHTCGIKEREKWPKYEETVFIFADGEAYAVTRKLSEEERVEILKRRSYETEMKKKEKRNFLIKIFSG